MKTTTIHLLSAATPVLAATEALRAMSGLPWAFAVMLAVAIVSAAFGAAVVTHAIFSRVSMTRAPLSLAKQRSARAVV